MHEPHQILRETINSLKEVVWWNRYLTKLSDPRHFKNFREILDQIIAVDGPYLERVVPPDVYRDPNGTPLSWLEFAENYEIHPSVKNAVNLILFGGKDGALFHHQGEAISQLCRKKIQERKRDLVISVPTATGKTECFLIPILDWCVHEYENTSTHYLKAIVIYPMKTLEVDQFNRIIKYLNAINMYLKEKNEGPLRVGIWDGDTPESPTPTLTIDEFVESTPVILPGESARGLECPNHSGVKLVWTREGEVKCEKGCHFPWIVTIRDKIRLGVDVLITNPEALEYALLSRKNIKLFGRRPSDRHVKYLVFDETHMWNGIGGTSISLFIKRLRNFYRDVNPIFVLSSATIPNPPNFASRLLGVPASEIIDVRYKDKSKLIPAPSTTPNFDHINLCSFHTLLATLFCLKKLDNTREGTVNKLMTLNIASSSKEVSNAINALLSFNLIKKAKDTFLILPLGQELLNCLPDGMFLDNFVKPEDPNSKISEILEFASLQETWANILLTKSPELLHLFTWFTDDYISEGVLVQKIASSLPSQEVEKARTILTTLLTWARIGGILYDRYHIFIKPPRILYWCERDKILSLTGICPKCGQECLNLRFCRNCHEPVVVEWNYRPIRITKPSRYKTGYRCRCGRVLNEANTKDPYVIYRTFVAWFLSFITRYVPSRKVLVFSDMRPEAEHIGSIARDLDYFLTADKLLLAKVIELENIGNPSYAEIQNSLRKDEIYQAYRKEDSPFYMLYKKKKPEIEILRGRYEHFLWELSQPDNNKRSRLYESALLSFKELENIDSPLKRAIGHYLLYLLLFKPSQKGHAKLPRIMTNRIYRKIAPYFRHTIKEYGKESFMKLTSEVVSRLLRLDFISKEMYEFEENGERKVVECIRIRNKDNLLFTVPEDVTYCENCYLGFPALNLAKCPRCGSKKINSGRRYTRSPSLSGNGYLENRHIIHAPFPLDHWGKELLQASIRQLKGVTNVDPIAVAIHRAGLPYEYRGVIEEGFRKSPPEVNVISSTPTMELGIDIGTLDCVCQIGIPPLKTDFVQRSGRTGRKRVKPSLIFTIIRNDHSVDNFYFEDLPNRFLNEPLITLTIPDATSSIIKGHVVSSIARFLNFNSADYESYYSILKPDPSAYAGIGFNKIAKKVVIPQLKKFIEDIVQYYSELIKEVSSIFSPWAIPESPKRLISEMFRGTETLPPEFMKKVDKILTIYKGLTESYSEVKNEFISRFAWLSLWLGHVNFMGNYRGIMEQVPLTYRTKRKGQVKLEEKSIDQALREAFPGPKLEETRVGVGALTRHAGFPYYITEVKSIPYPLKRVKICKNEQTCPFPFHAYSFSLTRCPLCHESLQTVDAYPYFSGICRPEFLTYRLETHAILAKHIEWEEGSNE